MDEKQRDALWYGLTLLPQAVQERIGKLVSQGRSAEDVIADLMVGPCPNCGGDHTRDDDDVRVCGADPGDTTVGVCLDCGYLWCLECGDALAQSPCPHWTCWSEYCKANNLEEEDNELMEEWLQRSK